MQLTRKQHRFAVHVGFGYPLTQSHRLVYGYNPNPNTLRVESHRASRVEKVQAEIQRYRKLAQGIKSADRPMRMKECLAAIDAPSIQPASFIPWVAEVGEDQIDRPRARVLGERLYVDQLLTDFALAGSR